MLTRALRPFFFATADARRGGPARFAPPGGRVSARNLGMRGAQVELPGKRRVSLPSTSTSPFHPSHPHSLSIFSPSIPLLFKQIRPIEFLFGPGSFALACDGLWAEFGVFDGGTLTLASNWRAAHCGPDAPPVFGFDTFSGLPEAWEQGAGGDTFDAGAFDLAGKLPVVPANARLVKGLFSETLPPFLMELRGGADHADLVGKSVSSASLTGRKGATPKDAASHVNPSGTGAAGHAPGRAASFLHIDCDLYAGARDALALLSPLIRPGTVLVFDDLINYAAYKEHEVKALWEWLASTGLHVRVIGVKGPLSGAAGAGGAAMELEPTTRHPHHQQSVAFVVV